MPRNTEYWLPGRPVGYVYVVEQLPEHENPYLSGYIMGLRTQIASETPDDEYVCDKCSRLFYGDATIPLRVGVTCPWCGHNHTMEDQPQ